MVKKGISKGNISIDQHQQSRENNIYWGDFPCKNIKTNRKLKKPLGHYFKSWSDYLKKGGDEFLHKK